MNIGRKVGVTVIYILLALHVAAEKTYSVDSFGAVSDGRTMCTNSIQDAIDQANSDGGGTVIFPKGTYLSGTINMKSNVSLHLANGATLLGSVNPKDYSPMYNGEYGKLYKWRALILAKNCENISILGNGIIDGRGGQLSLTIDSLFYAGKVDSADYNFNDKRPKYYLRPQLIYFYKCKVVNILNINLRNSSCWVQTYERCHGLNILGVTVESDAYWNNDGIDIVDSKNVVIRDCNINSSDDGICLKSESKEVNEFCDSILIENCKIRSSASAIKFGMGSLNHMKNISVRNIKVYDTYRSAVAIEAMQGGVLENILIENINAKNTGNAIFLRIGRYKNIKNAGVLRNVTIRNIKVKIPLQNPDYDYNIRGPELPFFHNVFPSSITGVPGHPIENVTIENIKIVYPGRGNKAYANMPLDRVEEVPELVTSYPEFSMFGELPAWGFYVRHAEGITMNNIKIKIRKPDYRPAMVFDDVKSLKLENVKIKGDEKPNPIFFNNTIRVKSN